MKTGLILVTLLVMGVGLLAQQANPFNSYLQNPGSAGFSEAVQYLTGQIQESRSVARNKALLIYIMNIETERLTDQLLAIADSLPAGERFTVGNVMLGMEKYDQAVALYAGLNRDFPNWSCPWRHKGEAYYKMGEFEEAVVALQQSIVTNERHYDAYVWLAFALNEIGQYREALEALERAKELDPEEEGHDDEEIPEERIEALLIELRARLER